MKIILVDDNVQFSSDLKYYIETKLSYNVIEVVTNGYEFLELLDRTLADIILMDIVMNEMDGFKTTKHALIHYSYLKIIAITMHIENVYLIKLIETGFKGCIYKSNLFTQLPIALKTVLSGNLWFPDKISLEKVY